MNTGHSDSNDPEIIMSQQPPSSQFESSGQETSPYEQPIDEQGGQIQQVGAMQQLAAGSQQTVGVGPGMSQQQGQPQRQ